MVQHVCGATHRCGNTLDLVMTFADCQLDAVTVDPPGIIYDHALVVCRLTAMNTTPTAAERLVRGWRRADRTEILRLLRASCLCQPVPDDADVDQLFASYEAVRCNIADKLDLRPSTLSVVVLDVRRPGSTTNVALNAVAVGVSNAATDVHGPPRIVGAGSTLLVADYV